MGCPGKLKLLIISIILTIELPGAKTVITGMQKKQYQGTGNAAKDKSFFLPGVYFEL